MTTDDDATVVDAGNRRPTLGAYELLRPVGKGGMGTVWEGRHTALDRRVAVKVLNPEFARNPELLARFLREGQAAARITHPHVATVYDVGEQGEKAFLVMEFLEGEDLAAVLARETRLDVARAVDLLLPVLAAIAATHAEGIVHRDLKPGNIFLTVDRGGALVPKVVDFGFSKVVEADVGDEDLTRRDTALGTLFYMPVEQVRSSRTAGPACDQYALGVTLYRCVTGRLPFEGRTPPETFAAIVRGQCPRPSELVALPTGLDEVILRAMHARADGRYPSVKAFGAALLPFASAGARARWAETFGVSSAPPPPTEPARPSANESTERLAGTTLASDQGRVPWRFVAAAVVLAALAFAAWLATR